jgi:diguanylate cyclase (GGDEF)-like protein
MTEAPKKGQIACSLPSGLLRHVRSTLGEDAVTELLERTGVPYDAEFLDDVTNWVWHEEAVALFAEAAELTGDPHVGLRVGESMVRQHAGTAVATLLRSLGSPEAVYEQLSLAATKFSTVTEMQPLEVAPGRAVVRARARDGFVRTRHLCDWSRGILSQPPALFGLPAATVEESTCQARGDDECLYSVTWDADEAAKASDPQQLVTALEAQLAAMHERLDSMYATAKDLIAFDDLDAALARITERAATAVRAPHYLLAVRTAPDEPPRVHHRGFDDDEARAAAELLLDENAAHDPSWLVADVASATRHYGRLMAASPTGAFFPHERNLLGVYASYAATVLDTATALEDARRQDARSRALLELSQAIADAGTSDEVGQRLADHVPGVIDCDRVEVFLWNEDEDALECRAVTGHSGENRDVLANLRIRRDDSPHLAALLDDPGADPLFFDPETHDSFVANVMQTLGSKTVVVAPIVVHRRFYGALVVSVTERAERLRRCADLLDRLTGVVAQAATALDNAKLIERMAHQARHDNLTGLLGHRAFHESLDEVLHDGAPVGGFTLATVDIDDFKDINDRFGHPVGDEALRLVADALAGAVREQDAVFRVGGEEFAVLLPGLSARDAVPLADRLRAAVAKVPFRVPLRVSVGLAAWPADAADRDGLLARADAALYQAKRAGKDRTQLAAAG